MKSNITHILQRISLLVALSFFVACTDYLDVTPKDRVSDDYVWESASSADLILNEIYGGIYAPINETDPIENFSDNAINPMQYNAYSRSTYNIGAYTPSNTPNNIWSGCYHYIRACNLFIENVSVTDFNEDWKKLRLAEARFLRAYYYHQLWMQYAGVPIITNVLDYNTQGEQIFRERNTEDETFDFLVDELQQIESDLPRIAESKGRVTQGAALTLKAWCELFKASPQRNPSNNKERWATAASTYKKVIDLDVYELFPDYESLFYDDNDNNKEYIFSKQVLQGTGGSREGFLGPSWVNGSLMSWNGSVPTQELVDSYVMENGLPITDPASGYDPQNPYVNREKRFYQSICYYGSTWLGEYMEIPSNIAEPQGGSATGYYWRKTIDPKYTVFGDNRLSGADWPFFRYAEVLLGYAEALNEANGPTSEVYNAINQVRERSDLPELEEGLTQEQMRTSIYRERRVELAFEDKRWLDLLRLKLAESEINGYVLHGMQIEKQDDGTLTYSVVKNTFNIFQVFDRDKHYLLPIPQRAMDKNDKLVQNPNY